MGAFRMDGQIVKFLRKSSGKKPISSVVSLAIRAMIEKPAECLRCKHQMDLLAGLEVGRQTMARKPDVKPMVDAWVTARQSDIDAVNKYAIGYRRPAREVVEQAVLEYVTCPKICKNCKDQEEMP